MHRNMALARSTCGFARGDGVYHTLMTPDVPRSNSQGERYVQTFFSDFLRRTKAFLIEESSARFLLSYRTTLNSTTGQSPAELFRLKTRLDLMRLDLKGKVFDKQSDQKYSIDKGGKEREFIIGQVLVQNFCENQIGLMVPLQSKPAMGPVSQTFREFFGPEKPVVKLQTTSSVFKSF